MRRSFTSKVNPKPASRAANAKTTRNIDFKVKAPKTPKKSSTQTIPDSTNTKVFSKWLKE